MEEWAEYPSSLIVKLHCDHAFHYHCIRDHWDVPDSITLRCPYCRSQDHPWGLHMTAGITPEVLDVWDYERVDPQQPNHSRTNDSLSLTYQINESDNLNKAERWSEAWGYGTARTGKLDGGERQPDVEMGMMRWARRGKNEYRRNLRRHLGESIHSLTDPGFERPPEPQMFPPPPGPDMIPPEGPGGEYGFDDDDGDSQAGEPMPGQYPDDDE
jgi:hypothetical protein